MKDLLLGLHVVVKTLKGSLRNDNGNDHKNATNDLIGWMRKTIVLHVQHAFGAIFWRSLPNDDVHEIFTFEVLATTRARSSKSLILCLCMKTIRAKQAKLHFVYFYIVTNLE